MKKLKDLPEYPIATTVIITLQTQNSRMIQNGGIGPQFVIL